VSTVETVNYSMPEEADLAETARLVEKEGARVLTRRADVRSFDQMRAAVDDAVAEFGKLDIVVANAGITNGVRPFHEISEQQWDVLMDVNLRGVWITCAAAVVPMLERDAGGSFILISSGAGLRAAPNMANYNVSKHGVIGLMKTMANELAPRHFRVNAICPSTVDTPMVQNEELWRAFRPDLPNPSKADVIEAFQAMNPIPEPWLEPSDISNAVLWLASDESRFVSGVALPVDLGLNNKAL
jgi:SDR family mycofactocin-dependent oxidoreductase